MSFTSGVTDKLGPRFASLVTLYELQRKRVLRSEMILEKIDFPEIVRIDVLNLLLFIHGECSSHGNSVSKNDPLHNFRPRRP